MKVLKGINQTEDARNPSVCLDPQLWLWVLLMWSPWDFVLPILLLGPSGWRVQLVPTQPEHKQLFIERTKAQTWLLVLQSRGVLPKSGLGSKWGQLLKGWRGHPFFLPRFVILSHKRPSLALSLPPLPPSGWEIQLRNSETAALSSSPEISSLLFLFVLHPSTPGVLWTWNIQHIFSAQVPCSGSQALENVADCRVLIFNQTVFISPFKAEALWVKCV